MATFDEQIREVARYVDEMRARGRTVREFSAPSAAAALRAGLPISLGPGASPGIILRGDTFVELGNPQAGSCALLLWTDNPALVNDGEITLVGPDIRESAGASLPFGQVIIAAGSKLGVEDHQVLDRAQYVGDQIEGYMVRNSMRDVWGRVSKAAAAKGFSFAVLGRALMFFFKSSQPRVEAVAITFVTSAKEDVIHLRAVADRVRTASAEIVKEQWKARGYDLDCDLDCRSCRDREVCDDVRKVIAGRARKAARAGGRGR